MNKVSNKRKIAISIATVFLVFFALSSPTSNVLAATVGGSAQVAPMNDEFINYINNNSRQSYLDAANRSLTNSGNYTSGVVPSPFKVQQGTSNIVQATVLPSKFDLRAISGKLSPIRSQGSSGSCWAFAAYGSLESALRPTVVADYSENNLKNNAGFDYPINGGGNASMATAYLARWSGPVAESSDPYNQTSTVSKTFTAQSHVQNVIYLPDRKNALDNTAIKSAVMNYGGVYTTMLYKDQSYNSTYKTYFFGSKGIANHAVDIVGWDDNFDRNKFYDANLKTKPAGNGAFICRNSWGTSWGQGGYFYISYYDTYIGKGLAVYSRAESASNYSSIYQYDTYGLTLPFGYGVETGWFANVYTAQATKYLSAASFYTVAPNASYEVYVVNNYSGTSSLAKSRVLVKSGKIATAGYNTVKFNNIIPITAGKKFAVVVKITTPGYYWPIPTEFAAAGYSSKATAAAGQSYVAYDGVSWSDLTTFNKTANVNLKAFTK
ncbi:MAG: lectin like domain-containing protein [Clostridiaceae bacterium]